jgi:hypothetical protein
MFWEAARRKDTPIEAGVEATWRRVVRRSGVPWSAITVQYYTHHARRRDEGIVLYTIDKHEGRFLPLTLGRASGLESLMLSASIYASG